MGSTYPAVYYPKTGATWSLMVINPEGPSTQIVGF